MAFEHGGPAAAAASVGCTAAVAPRLFAGSALIMDSRVLHQGGANTSPLERTLFYFTMRRAGDEDEQWKQSSIRESLRDRYSLASLMPR